jgi:hypothetical protein
MEHAGDPSADPRPLLSGSLRVIIQAGQVHDTCTQYPDIDRASCYLPKVGT